MKRLLSVRLLGVFFAAALTFGGCSDDGGTTPKDSSPDRKGLDIGVDAPSDGALDAGSDGVAPEAGREAGSDGATDGSGEATTVDLTPDLTPDITQPDLKPGTGLFGTVTSKIAPMFDGKGQLFIMLLNFPPPFPPVDQAVVSAADFSKVGNKVTFQFFAKPAAGNYTIYAFLDDNDNAASPFISADASDLAMAQGIPLTVTAGPAPQKVDLELDAIVGGAGGGLGALVGNIKSSVSPTLDARGTIYVSLHDKWPPGAALTSTSIANADLSSPFSSAKYFLGGLQPGLYYMQVWLDDNSNANIFVPGPDKDDLIHGAPIQVRVEADVTGSLNITLDTVKP